MARGDCRFSDVYHDDKSFSSVAFRVYLIWFVLHVCKSGSSGSPREKKDGIAPWPRSWVPWEEWRDCPVVPAMLEPIMGYRDPTWRRVHAKTLAVAAVVFAISTIVMAALLADAPTDHGRKAVERLSSSLTSCGQLGAPPCDSASVKHLRQVRSGSTSRPVWGRTPGGFPVGNPDPAFFARGQPRKTTGRGHSRRVSMDHHQPELQQLHWKNPMRGVHE